LTIKEDKEKKEKRRRKENWTRNKAKEENK
jgi:hypothetical protein